MDLAGKAVAAGLDASQVVAALRHMAKAFGANADDVAREFLLRRVAAYFRGEITLLETTKLLSDWMTDLAGTETPLLRMLLHALMTQLRDSLKSRDLAPNLCRLCQVLMTVSAIQGVDEAFQREMAAIAVSCIVGREMPEDPAEMETMLETLFETIPVETMKRAAGVALESWMSPAVYSTLLSSVSLERLVSLVGNEEVAGKGDGELEGNHSGKLEGNHGDNKLEGNRNDKLEGNHELTHLEGNHNDKLEGNHELTHLEGNHGDNKLEGIHELTHLEGNHNDKLEGNTTNNSLAGKDKPVQFKEDTPILSEIAPFTANVPLLFHTLERRRFDSLTFDRTHQITGASHAVRNVTPRRGLREFQCRLTAALTKTYLQRRQNIDAFFVLLSPLTVEFPRELHVDA